MDDAVLVRRVEGSGDLTGNGEGGVERYWAARDLLRQILAVHELHHQRARFEPIDVRDVRMIERREYDCFATEACDAIGIAGKGVRQHLQRHVAIQARVTGTVDLAHAAGADH